MSLLAVTIDTLLPDSASFKSREWEAQLNFNLANGPACDPGFYSRVADRPPTTVATPAQGAELAPFDHVAINAESATNQHAARAGRLMEENHLQATKIRRAAHIAWQHVIKSEIKKSLENMPAIMSTIKLAGVGLFEACELSQMIAIVRAAISVVSAADVEAYEESLSAPMSIAMLPHLAQLTASFALLHDLGNPLSELKKTSIAIQSCRGIHAEHYMKALQKFDDDYPATQFGGHPAHRREFGTLVDVLTARSHAVPTCTFRPTALATSFGGQSNTHPEMTATCFQLEA